MTFGHRGGAKNARRVLPPKNGNRIEPTPLDGSNTMEGYLIPENSLAAFRYAAQQGASGIEIDVHLTKDDIPVVLHDAFVSKTLQGGSGSVGDYTLQELQKLSYIQSCTDHETERVPTLHQVLNLAKEKGLKVMIEIKEVKKVKLCCAMVVQTVRNLDMQSQVFVASFNPLALYQVRKLETEVETCCIFTAHTTMLLIGELKRMDKFKDLPRVLQLLAENAVFQFCINNLLLLLAHPLVLAFIGCRMVAMESQSATPQRLQHYRNKGILCACWTVNTLELKEKMLGCGLSVITDYLGDALHPSA